MTTALKSTRKVTPIPGRELRLAREAEARWRSRWALEQRARAAWVHWDAVRTPTALWLARRASEEAAEAML